MANRVGEQLGKYRLIRLLGRGSFAEVYLGEHVHLKTEAAVKVLHGQLAEDDAGDFLKEAQTIARLVHPHIVRIFDFDVQEGTPFLVMDYAPNGTLRQRHPKGIPLPLQMVVQYVKQVANALQYAHDQKLIHRDVKPENMLIGRRHEILLSDFGTVQVLQSTHVESEQKIAGTVAYMSPEQLQGRARPASDQYALGIVVYEWLCGERPFQGAFSAMASQHIFTPPAPLREKIPAIPPGVEGVVLTALAKDYRQRFASIQAFATALEQACFPNASPASPLIYAPPSVILPQPSTAPIVVRQPSQFQPPLVPASNPSLPAVTPVITDPPARAQQLLQSMAALTPSGPTSGENVTSDQVQTPKRGISRRTVLIGLVGLAAAGAGITWWALSSQQHQSGVLPTPTPLGEKNTIYIYHGHSGLVVDVAWSPDGTRIASASADRTAQVWDATTGSHALTYSGHSDEVRAVPWSPDGKRIASASDDNTVQVWDAATGNRFYIYGGHSAMVLDVAWSHDGKRIASASADTTVQVWDAATGKHIYTYSGHFVVVDTVAWSPDGKLIASAGHDRTVQVWVAATGKRIYTYSGHSAEVRDVAWSPDGTRIASGSVDRTVQVWDATTGGHAVSYLGHSGFVYAVAWSPDGTHIASADYDKTVQVWVADTGSNLLTYRGHSAVVEAVAWSPEGKLIASGGVDRTVQVWTVM